MSTTKQTFLRIFPLFSLFLFFDQISKFLIFKYFSQKTYFFFAKIGLQYQENTGIAFGIKMPQPVIIILNIIILFGLVYIFFQEINPRKKTSILAISLILAGAFGNIIDRFTYGFVVDFIAIFSYPRFNLADTYITLAVLLLIVFYGKIRRS